MLQPTSARSLTFRGTNKGPISPREPANHILPGASLAILTWSSSNSSSPASGLVLSESSLRDSPNSWARAGRGPHACQADGRLGVRRVRVAVFLQPGGELLGH